MKNEIKSKLTRRNFLIAVGAGGAATAAAIAGRAVSSGEPEAVARNDKRRGKGYQAGIAFDNNLPMGSSSCVSCGECMVSCPTGALTNKSWLRMVPAKG